MNKNDQYFIVVSPLSEEDGGGFIARVPDLPGCLGDGESPTDALIDVQKAIVEWVDEYERIGRDVPAPGSYMKNTTERRKKELKVLTNLQNAFLEHDHDLQELEAQIDLIKNDVDYIIDMIHDSEAWERFSIITKVPYRSKKEFLSGLIA